jgi:hypothetical protein
VSRLEGEKLATARTVNELPGSEQLGGPLKPQPIATAHRHQPDRALPNHALTVYDGTNLAGTITKRNGEFIAFDITGHRVGVFMSQRDAVRAIPAVGGPL